MPEISIIVPVYKAERYLDRCIQSILTQTFTDYELILVDDGSPDRCSGMCDNWAKRDERIVVIHKENGGASSARNAGLAVARGKYVGFVDSDDWIDKRMYKRLHDLIVRYDADMSLCKWYVVSEETVGKAVSNPLVNIWGKKECLDSFFRVDSSLDTWCVWSGLYKASLLRNFSFYEGRMNEDCLYCYQQSVYCGKAVQSNEKLYYYFRNKTSVTNSGFTLKKLDLIFIWDRISEMVQELTPDYIAACDMNRKRAYFTLLSKMLIDGYDKKDPKLRQVHGELKRKVRSYFWELMQWNMPISRKILMCFLII